MNNAKFENWTFLSDVTSTYCLYIGPSTQKDYSEDVYKVVNKDTEVVEAELSILPRAYQYCLDLEEDLSAIEHVLAGMTADLLDEAEGETQH